MRYISVCSGIEAASVAWKPLGYEPVAFSEIDPFACNLLKYHYPNIPNVGDMTSFNWSKYHGAADIIIGGTPCQSFSIAGKREGMADPRGHLATTFIELVANVRPQWVVWENVPGVLSSSGGGDFKQFATSLVSLGYHVAWRMLDAQYFGVPQRRRRVFLVGYFRDWRLAAAVLFEPESLHRDIKKSKKRTKDITGTFTAGAYVGGAGGRPEVAAASFFMPAKTLLGHGLRVDAETENFIVESIKSYMSSSHGAYHESIGTLRASGGDLGGGSESIITVLNDQGGAFMKSSTDGKIGTLLSEAHGHLPIISIQTAHTQANGSNVKEDGNTFTHDNSGNVQSIYHNNTVRRLTPMECERLMGFPDNYTNIPNASDTARYKALGNSIVVPVLSWLGKRIQAKQ